MLHCAASTSSHRGWTSRKRRGGRSVLCLFQLTELIKLKGPFIKQAAAAEGPVGLRIALPSGALPARGEEWACAEGSVCSRPSANTHSELWFANEKWMANTIHELCSCHGDINQQRASPLSLVQCVCRIKMHGVELFSPPHRAAWVNLRKNPQQYRFCQLVRGLLQERRNYHTPTGTHTGARDSKKLEGKMLYFPPRGVVITPTARTSRCLFCRLWSSTNHQGNLKARRL